MGWCNKPTKLQFPSIFNTDNFDALKRYETIEFDRRTWLHVPWGTLWSTSSGKTVKGANFTICIVTFSEIAKKHIPEAKLYTLPFIVILMFVLWELLFCFKNVIFHNYLNIP